MCKSMKDSRTEDLMKMLTSALDWEIVEIEYLELSSKNEKLNFQLLIFFYSTTFSKSLAGCLHHGQIKSSGIGSPS